MNNYRFDNGLNWKATLKYDHSRGAMVYQSPMSIIDLKSAANQGVYNYMYRDINGQTKAYNGQYVQTRMSCLNAGKMRLSSPPSLARNSVHPPSVLA